MLCGVIRTGELRSARLKQAYYNDTSVGAKRVRYLTRNVINTVAESKSAGQRYPLEAIEGVSSASAKP